MADPSHEHDHEHAGAGHDHHHDHAEHGHGQFNDPGGDDHLHDDEVVALEDNPLWLEDNIVLSSVGIDIGSAGTQVVFSRLWLRRLGEELSSRYVIVGRDTVFESQLALTPFTDADTIDAHALGQIIDSAYAGAGVRPEQIDTGIVILTGEALKRTNSAAIADIVAERAGDLVCASAGHNMEARLAAYGSGAVQRSYEDHSRLLNVDIGGGTTKYSLIQDGKILATAAVSIGGRLQVMEHGRIVRLAAQGASLASAAGYRWGMGSEPSAADLDRFADLLADAVVSSATGSSADDDPFPDLWLTEPLPPIGRLDGVVFSGGVSEYVYGRQEEDFGDLGKRLGLAIRRRVDDGAFPAPAIEPPQVIRATVLGASEYSVQLSGRTCFISDPNALLPRRNLPVAKVRWSDDPTVQDIGDAVLMAIADYESLNPDADLAIAIDWDGGADYPALRSLADGIAMGLAERTARGRPAYILVDADVARTLGSILAFETGAIEHLAVLDGLRFWDFDFLDLGRVLEPSHSVPVTVKSMVFAADSRTG